LKGKGINTDFDYKNTGAVFFGYLDIHYVVASFGLGFYSFNPARFEQIPLSLNYPPGSPFEDMSSASRVVDERTLNTFEIELLGKYPFDIGREMTIFPLLGFNFRILNSRSRTVGGEKVTNTSWVGGTPIGDSDTWSWFWFKFGLGMDIPLNSAYTVYLRPMLLYGFGNGLGPDNHGRLEGVAHHGLDIKATIGFIF